MLKEYEISCLKVANRVIISESNYCVKFLITALVIYNLLIHFQVQ